MVSSVSSVVSIYSSNSRKESTFVELWCNVYAALLNIVLILEKTPILLWCPFWEVSISDISSVVVVISSSSVICVILILCSFLMHPLYPLPSFSPGCHRLSPAPLLSSLSSSPSTFIFNSPRSSSFFSISPTSSFFSSFPCFSVFDLVLLRLLFLFPLSLRHPILSPLHSLHLRWPAPPLWETRKGRGNNTHPPRMSHAKQSPPWVNGPLQTWPGPAS